MAARTIEKAPRKKRRETIDSYTPPAASTAAHPLDSEKSQTKLSKLKDWWYQAQEEQSENRVEMAIDEAYYDGDQWTEEEKNELINRGQAPVVFNLTKTTVNWILGAQSRAKIDYKIVPRKKDGVNAANAKTELLKYVGDANKSHYVRSRAFKDAVIAGVGWIETGIRTDPTEEPLYTRYENWRNIWYDHLSIEHDMSDARFIFRAKWVDLDIAQAMFPNRAAALEIESENVSQLYPWMPDDPIVNRADAPQGTVSNVDETNILYRRRRVRLIECWYKEIAKVKVVRGEGPINGTILVKDDPYIQKMVEDEQVSVFDAIKTITKCAIFCGSTFLQDELSPYRYADFPFTPIWCYRRGKDNAPYGIIRDLRDVQDDLNKRRSKALYLLSSNKIIADDNATDDWQQLHYEANRPDGIVKKRPGTEVRIEQGAILANYHVQLAHEDAKAIQDIAGVTDENMGRDTNAESGTAIKARQEQGYTTNNFLFDNLYLAIQCSGEKELSLVEQYYSEPKTIRILGSDMGRLTFLDINQMSDDGMMNDITATKADFIVSRQDYRETIRQAMFEAMMELTSHLSPEIALNLLDMVIDLSDLPNKAEIISRIRTLNGQKDPGLDKSDPQVIAEEEAKAADQSKQKAMQDRLMAAEVALKEADATLKKAKADQTLSDSTAKSVEALYSAIQTALVIVQTPGVSTIADSIAKSAGYIDKDAAPIIPQYSGGISGVPQIQQNTSPMFPPRPIRANTGIMEGIET